MSNVVVYFVYTITLIYSDSFNATIYYPQVFQDSHMYVVSSQCARIDMFTLDCWDIYDGTIQLKITASCRTDPIWIGVSQRSRAQGQVWQPLTIPNPEPCPAMRTWYFPWVPFQPESAKVDRPPKQVKP